ncbi:Chromo domain-like protein [Ascosphaera apis ARSEF 7405]|uniref:Chromo domain-like protein n=1 Tax=Ascosphaera apis ARSEF 7405 TaxID=392613 RepID=A0A168C6J6_9EURO|nr:Chromo domain-like protein [Ascosphaera apis ARSEF 7405]
MGESISPTKSDPALSSKVAITTSQTPVSNTEGCVTAGDIVPELNKELGVASTSPSAKRKATESSEGRSPKRLHLDDLPDVDPFQGDLVAEIQEYLTSQENEEAQRLTQNGRASAVSEDHASSFMIKETSDEVHGIGQADKPAHEDTTTESTPAETKKSESAFKTDGPEPPTTTSEDISRTSHANHTETPENDLDLEHEHEHEPEQEKSAKSSVRRSARAKTGRQTEKPSRSSRAARSSRSQQAFASGARTTRANSRVQTRSRTQKQPEPKSAALSQRMRRAKPQKSKKNEDEVYEVEAIIDHKDSRRGVLKRPYRYYLVHWKGYPKDEATWEPAKFLVNAKEAVDQYLQIAEKKAATSRTRSRTRS